MEFGSDLGKMLLQAPLYLSPTFAGTS